MNYLLEEDGFFCKIDLKDACFSLLLCISLKKVCKIRMVEKSLRVSLPLFWIRTWTQDFFKNYLGIHGSNEVVEHLPSDIYRQYFSDGKDRGNFK